MATEIDMSTSHSAAATPITLENGIQQHAVVNPDVAAIQPSVVVKHLMKKLRDVAMVAGGGFENLQTVRCFFILSMTVTTLDITELLVDVEFRSPPPPLLEMMDGLGLEEREQRGRLELRGNPVIAYGWGTGLWLGVTKDLASRAWF
jgi:hypothetical protein